MKRYRVCQSITGLKRLIEQNANLDYLTINDRPATLYELIAAIEDAEAKGYIVLPPCDNVNSTGHCVGHEVFDIDIEYIE